jgi:hypothetical protein
MQEQHQYDPRISKSHSPQPHKFFDRNLDNNLEELSEALLDRYGRIERAELEGITPVTDNEYWKDSNSVSTMKWRQYNVFQFYIPGIRKLYDAISDMVHEACDYYEVDFDEQQFMLQGWFNVNHSKSGKLNWHDHSPVGAPFFHGYYSVTAEPSETHYYAFGEHKINNNINNRAILSEMGHSHAMADWDWDGPRISVAYDISPLSSLRDLGPEDEQHWLPLR